MFGSYSSYSSMSTVQIMTPIDIGASTASTVCAFPSWPRRSYLDDRQPNATSYLSDEDLFWDDDNYSSASSSSSRANSAAGSFSPPADWRQAAQPFVENVAAVLPTEEELEQQALLEAEARRQRQAYQREMLRSVIREKESRKQAAQAARRQRRAAAAAAGSVSPKKTAKLSAITEA